MRAFSVVLVPNAFARPQSLDDIFNQIFTSTRVPSVTSTQSLENILNQIFTTTRVPSVTNFRPLVRNPTTPSTTTTAQPPQFTRCIETCPKTAQYNPVCGSNRQTYNNISVLRCARRCGLGKLCNIFEIISLFAYLFLDITQIRPGVCAPRGK